MLVGRVVGRGFLFTVLIFQGMCICRFCALLTVVRGFQRRECGNRSCAFLFVEFLGMD